MSNLKAHILTSNLLILLSGFLIFPVVAGSSLGLYSFQQDTLPADTVKTDTIPQPYEPNVFPTFEPYDRYGDPISNPTSESPLFLDDPSNLEMDVEIDTGMNYTISERMGDVNYRPATYMTFEEFDRYQNQKLLRDYWKERSLGLDGESAVSGRRLIPKLYISPVLDRIFGGSYVDIQPNGFVNLDFGGRWQKVANPSIPVRQQRNGGFNYNQQISMNVVGKVGEKLAITANFDNNNSFDFQNNLKVEYTGYEEDIIKSIEIGNVSMPVKNSLITGAQSLFGLKTQLQFGKLYVTGIVSRQQGRNEVINVESGFQGREFEVRSSNYDDNRRFFLGHFFRDNYERWLSGLPQILSGLNITRVEVYSLNRNNDTQTLRNFVGLMDLGEGSVIYRPENPNIGSGNGGPNDNAANNLFAALRNDPNIRNIDDASALLEDQYGLVKSTDFERVTSARKLDDREYFVNRELGYVSLLRKLQNDEVLAVSYEYTYNGRRYKVGELMEDYQNLEESQAIILKLLRPTRIDTRIPTWDLMMKNIYNLNASQIDRDGFNLRIQYRDDLTGIDNPSLHEGARTKDQPLIRLLGLDQLNPNNDPAPDGNFDYIEGLTIDPRNGNIIFPVLEPFGRTLESYFDQTTEQNLINKYVYDTLYNTTKADAEQVASKDKFFIVGRFMSGSASEIVLPGINIAENSVTVMAGNTPLTEGLDYTVDYNLGRVRIINDGVLNSGKQIQIGYEKADLFNFQTRWLTGANFDYRFSEDINFGATILHLNERPGGITRFRVGDEPTRNTKYGFDLNVNKDSRLLTRMVDALPFISTKEKSTINFSGEFAQIIPGTSNLVEGEGTSYIDDFEAAITPITLGNGPLSWMLGSTPQTSDNRFDLSDQTDTELGYAYKRAKLAWYVIDPVFYLNSSINKPDNITNEDVQNHYVRAISPQEIFRQQDRQLVNTNLPVFDIAYYPSERGQYNYNPDLTSSGFLRDPESNYGAITKAITNEVDFDKTNVEYLEFWMMDPFIEGERGRVLDGVFNQNNTTGGELIFNLGNVSEDLMRDGRHAFENGLPPDYDEERVITNEWGRVTDQTYINDFFDNNADTRENQDVGLDGLKSEDEAAYFRDNFINQLPVNSQALQQIQQDASADDFQYYLGPEFDSRDVKVLERYKNFNGMENNTPIATGGTTFAPQGAPTPENEDLNRDNTLTDLEDYYEYRLKLEPGDLEVGKNHIVDRIVDQSGEAAWYLFRIPIRDPDNIIGNISGFKSMRFLRMYMTGWQQPAVLRMVKFQLVGSQWRKYLEGLNEKGFNEVPESYTSDFTVSVVNIEENSADAEGKTRYVVPPGINRDFDNTTVIQRRNNEQSLQICVEDLEDRDARAVFKNVSLDLLQYGRIKMFLHAEAHAGDIVNDDEVTAFLRFGTDFTENYYEVEVPMKMTPLNLSGSGDEIARLVWPLENEIDLDINELYALKSTRNRSGRSLELPFTQTSDNERYQLSIVGRPDMSAVMTMMIGVRNPSSEDKAPKSVCIWANELRVTDFNTEEGWAANARLSAKLADFATVTASTRYTTFGFGSIQQRISERTREETTQYDVSANVNVDKLLPSETGIKIPMFVSYEKSRVTPRFDPLDPDIPLEASLLGFESDLGAQNYRQLVEDRMERRSLNFTNVRKERTNPESRKDIWDIENFAFSYAYSDIQTSNVNTAEYVMRQYRGGVSWNFSPKEKPIEPFKNISLFDGKYLQLIKDFNFNPVPGNLSVRGDLDRRFVKTQLRNADLTTDGIDPFYEKYFTFNRTYNMRWNLTKSLSLDYSARARAIIDEPEGDIDTQAKRDSIWNNVKRLGRMKNFNQTVSANYRLPLDKIPLTDWISADVRYSATFDWIAGSIDQQDSLGNIASNSRERAVNGKFDMVGLYNKIPFLKDINTPARTRSRRGAPRQDADSTDIKKSQNKVAKGFLRLLMSLRSVNFSYSIRESTTLPGFLPTPELFGFDEGFDAPGVGFLFGDQDADIRFRAAENNWLAKSSFLTQPFTQVLTEDLNIRGALEPFGDLKIQLDARKQSSGNFQEIFRFDSDSANAFVSLTPARSGSYTISYVAIKTAFLSDIDDEEYNHPAFNDFVSNREIIRSRLNQINPAGEYQINSQDVLIPSFLAAYSGADANDVTLTPFPKTPIPNWRVDYAGLSKIPALQDIFSSVNLTHAYQSTFSVGNFTNSLLYDQSLDLNNRVTDYPLASRVTENGLVPVYVINQVAITERFSPLIGINVRTKNQLTAKIDYKRERNLSLNLSNSQITEMTSSDISFDIGFTKDKFKLPFRVQGRTITLENDLQFRMSFTIRDTKTIQRKIDETNVITNGNINFQLRPTVSYLISDKLNLTMYFERNINEPRLTNAFRRTTTAFGAQLRFSLSQ